MIISAHELDYEPLTDYKIILDPVGYSEIKIAHFRSVSFGRFGNMVIVRLIGGLGNQMFQYAAARRLSILHQTTLKLDITAFENYKLRRYGLKPFNIQEVFATPQEIALFKGPSKKGLPRKVFRLGQKLRLLPRKAVFSEPGFSPYNPNILKTPKDVYLQGSWQSEKYFVDIEDVIRREFTVKVEQDPQSREIAEQIMGTHSVSIHVRRGDYVLNRRIKRVHGTCSLDYCSQCVSLIAEKITRPHFFVFSDDPSWVTENLRFDYPTTFVTHNDATRDYEDLRLMSMCKHDIIANSSFSWWGAWLNANPDKIVLAPRKWFNEPDKDDPRDLDTRDLFPDGWIKV